MKKNLRILFLFLMGFNFMQAQEWQTDYETASKEASKNGFPIILVFKGSDWCAPCIKLDKEVFKTDIFNRFAKNHFVLLEADFPRKRKNALSEQQRAKNNSLAEKYNPNGIFPFVVILDAHGKVLGETGYKKLSANEYINHLESFKG